VSAPVVEMDGVRFTYPTPPGANGARRFEIRDVSLAVAPGEIVGVIGPNGSGKTTLVRLLSGLLTPTAGVVRLEGEPMTRLPRARVATRVAVVAQDSVPGFPYTVGELVLMGRFPHGPGRFFETAEDAEAAARAMAMAGVEALAGEPLDRLSGGERQRAHLARALAQRPRVLVLDEPTAHLDLRYQVECVALLRRLHADEDLAVVLVTHDLSLAGELCQRLLLLDGGRPVRLGPPADVLERAVLESVYRCAVEVSVHPASGRPRVAVVWPGAEPAREGR
jgi:iron complex transport system ATP-binding protein